MRKPWGLVSTSEGRRFATAEETAYPWGLAHEIARCFALTLVKRGWSPPPTSLDNDVDLPPLKKMRAVAGVQPKASKLPPLVPEHKEVLLVAGPMSSLSKLPLFPMQRLKEPLVLPADCTSSVRTMPAESQLLIGSRLFG